MRSYDAYEIQTSAPPRRNSTSEKHISSNDAIRRILMKSDEIVRNEAIHREEMKNVDFVPR